MCKGYKSYLGIICALVSVSFAAGGCVENGPKGDVSSLVSFQQEAAGEHCQAGGFKVISGLDKNSDGVLDEDEILSSQYICNGVGDKGDKGEDGVDGKPILGNTSSEVGEHCENGGIRFDVGNDDNGNGVLDEDEIQSSAYVCNGANGKDGKDGTNTSVQTSIFSGEKGEW